MCVIQLWTVSAIRSSLVTMTTNTDSPILVLGGTGKTGRRVAARLDALGQPVRIGSRMGQPPFDWDDAATWPAVKGTTAVYVTYQPDLSFPGAAERIGAFARAAVATGVERFVLLSGRGEPEAVPAEDAIRAAGVPWTILRASWFAQNFSEYFLLGPVLDGVVALPAGNVAEPFVDADDVAAVAVAALTESGHDGRTYELTGPRLLTFTDAAAEIAAAIGRHVHYVAVTPTEYASEAVAQGVPAEEAGPMAELFARVLDGHNAHLDTGVRQALGREPRDFSAYVRDAAASGVWSITGEAVAR
jgi:uncharacterized protein YbjT (DUF2867 family)